MPNYLTDQIITYMGNKRKILPHIANCIDAISEREGGRPLSMADAFSGSGVVARLLKTKTSSSHLYVNDCAGYSETLNRCFLANPIPEFMTRVNEYIAQANALADANELLPDDAWISKHWAPRGEITPEHRVYYTEENGRRIDIIRNFITTLPPAFQPFLLAPLLVEASIHNNTNGQFTAYYKDGDRGAFGGSKGNDIKRITAPIRLNPPVLHDDPSTSSTITPGVGVGVPTVNISRSDANEWINQLPNVDVLYLDPPYNKHPYCIYYFMLDIINDWDKTIDIPTTYRGQPKNWTKSSYNSSRGAVAAFTDLITRSPTKYIIMSYNDEGIIPLKQMGEILELHGTVEKVPIKHKVYNRLRGIAGYKREKEAREVKEFIWVLTKRDTR